ncbi:MAG: DUF1577 domain-containing protein [Spirochaetales bacterium]|nr:DUF1577 domain-containing protein [Leptospiraceae bacterium]MCP5483547.1 DUF1577 domain-containing protein [Spirochaetales bacterium]MCP5486882.1 DUF1577 domain-containing protein [Spirochaetales bacterium]
MDQDQESRVAAEETLIRAIQQILKSSHEDYTEDTILGSDINQTRHLFYFLRGEQRMVLLNYGLEVYRGRVVRVYEENLAELEVPGFQPEMIRRCRIKFEIVNVLYQFEVAIVDIEGDRLTIRIPTSIQSATRRKNPRLPLDDMFMRFIILYQPLMGRRGVGQIIQSRFGAIERELREDDPDLHLVHRVLVEEVRKISPDYEIKLYQKGERRSLIENTVSEQRKTIFLSSVSKLDSYFQPRMPHGMINFSKEYHHRLKESSEEDAAQFFEHLQQADMRDFLANYVCAPIMIFDRVIGHIYVYTTVFDRRHIDADQAFRVDLLAKLLSHAMSKSVLARTYFKHTYTRIANISLSGLLFEINDRVIFDYLTYHDRIKMLIQIKHNLLTMSGEITRYFPSRDGFKLGVEFFKAGPGDFKVLENFIFESVQQERA